MRDQTEYSRDVAPGRRRALDGAGSAGPEPAAEIDLLKKQLEELRQRDEKTKQQLEEMQRRLDVLQSQPPAQEKAPADKLEEAVQELPKAPTPPTTFAPALASQRLGGTTFGSSISPWTCWPLVGVQR